MQLLHVLLFARARAPIAVTGGPMADRSRPAALEKVGVQNGVSLHDAEKVDGVATGVAIPNGSARLPTVTKVEIQTATRARANMRNRSRSAAS